MGRHRQPGSDYIDELIPKPERQRMSIRDFLRLGKRVPSSLRNRDIIDIVAPGPSTKGRSPGWLILFGQRSQRSASRRSPVAEQPKSAFDYLLPSDHQHHAMVYEVRMGNEEASILASEGRLRSSQVKFIKDDLQHIANIINKLTGDKSQRIGTLFIREFLGVTVAGIDTYVKREHKKLSRVQSGRAADTQQYGTADAEGQPITGPFVTERLKVIKELNLRMRAIADGASALRDLVEVVLTHEKLPNVGNENAAEVREKLEQTLHFQMPQNAYNKNTPGRSDGTYYVLRDILNCRGVKDLGDVAFAMEIAGETLIDPEMLKAISGPIIDALTSTRDHNFFGVVSQQALPVSTLPDAVFLSNCSDLGQN